jgi:hypothetical protein
MCDDFKSNRYFKKLYASKLRLSRRVLGRERRAALSLSKFLGNLSGPGHQTLGSDLEWLFTWKLKTSSTAEPFWCDGVSDIELIQTGKYSFKISAVAWVGQEADINTINKEKCSGNVILKPSGKGFNFYEFIICYGNEKLVLKKT